jgi:signal transduction histidine kinase
MAGGGTARPLVLAVEDELPIVELLTALVAPLDVQLVAAADGRQALAMLDQLRPALITLDLVLPDLDGFQVLEEVRGRREYDDVAVIVVTAMPDSQAMRRAYALGAADYIVKPFAVDMLEAKLRRHLRTALLAEEMRERQRLLEEVVEHLSSGLVVCDADGRVRRLNAAGAAQLGLADAQRAIGKRLDELAPGAGALVRAESGGEGQRVQERCVVRTPSGERPLGFSSSRLGDGGVVVVFRELSAVEQARREAEQRAQHEALARGARSFAHEVRNPLTAITAASQMLARDDLDRALRRRLAGAVEGEAARIVGMVREYVERQAPPEPSGEVDVRALLDEVVEVNLLGTAARSRVRIECAPSLPSVRADGARLKQAVLNLVQNAIAATEQGGAVTLMAAHSDGPDGGVKLVVRDTGQGIPPANLARIFDEGFTTRTDGCGLGLAIARRIVEAHGGALRVESRLGEGAAFTITLRAR